MVTNEPYRYSSLVSEPTAAGPGVTVCGLPGCDVPVVQPAGGGRRRLYCSNAHRAEARRRRLAAAPEQSSPDVLGVSLDRLAGVLDDLTHYRDKLQSIDPTRQAAEAARLRAETTAEVLAAQQASARAADDAAQARDQLAAERAERESDRASHRAEVEELRAALVAARENAASAADALDQALADHRDELERREQAAAATATAHQEETHRLLGDLEQVRSALAAAEARADAADHRAATSESANKRTADHLARTEKLVHRLEVDLAKAQAAASSATERAEELARRLDSAQTELEVERQRHGASLAQLHDQLAQLLAQRPARRRTTTAEKNASSPVSKTSRG